PVLIGGGGEKRTLRLVAQHATMWHWFSSGEEFARKKQVLEQHCADVGRDPAEIELSVAARGNPEVNGPALLEQGSTLFTVGISGPDFDLSTARAWVDWRNKSTIA
ncbi:MAG TPA: LLM class F420-dependent oxidoreductase, partial [Pseudonocardiaceae bacterium]